MTPLQDTIALVVAASTGILLFASVPAQTPPRPTEPTVAPGAARQATIRDLCEPDLARFCRDASVPDATRACMLANAGKLKPACRSALQAAGLIPE